MSPSGQFQGVHGAAEMTQYARVDFAATHTQEHSRDPVGIPGPNYNVKQYHPSPQTTLPYTVMFVSYHYEIYITVCTTSDLLSKQQI